MNDSLRQADAGAADGESGPAKYVEEVVEYVDNKRQRAVLAGLLVVLFLLLLGVSFWVVRLTRPASAPRRAALPGGMEWVRSIYGWGKLPNQQLVAPTDVAVGPDGTIWCLSEHRTIVAFNPDGSAKRVVQPRIGASLEGISVDENGDVFVADYGGQIIHFKPDGSAAATWSVELPSELDVKAGRIAVAAAKGVAVFTLDDQILAKFGTRGQGKDQFDLPHGIVQTSDRLYVSDTQNRRVKAFTSVGRPLWVAGEAPDRTKPGAGDIRSADTSNAPFELPAGMTTDGKGRLVLVDAFKFQIIALDPSTGQVAHDSSKHKAVYGDQGGADGYFMYPTGISYDRTRDWFVVADTGNDRLQVVRIPGSGGGALSRVAGTFSLPMCVFLIPLLLLLIALILAARRHRRDLRQRLTARAP